MKLLDVHNNDRVDIMEILLNDHRLEDSNFKMPAKTSICCAHCFRERRQVRQCSSCAAEINNVRSNAVQDDSPKSEQYMKLVPSALVYFMLKADGYLSVEDTKKDAATKPFDDGLKSFMAQINLMETSRILRHSMQHDVNMTCQLLEMSAISIEDVSAVCPYYFSKKILEVAFKFDFDFVAVASDEGSGDSGDSDADTIAKISLDTIDAIAKRDLNSEGLEPDDVISPGKFSDDLKSCILPGYKKQNENYIYFVNEVVLNRNMVFKCPTHKLFLDKFMAANVHHGVEKSGGALAEDIQLAIHMTFSSVIWLQFVRAIVPEGCTMSSDLAYSYVNTYLVHSKQDDIDLFNSMMDDFDIVF